MSNKTLSEQLIEEFCARHRIEWRRIKVAQTPGNRRPDYAIRVGGGWCILEVKELIPTDEDNDLLEELRRGITKGRWVAPGKRLRGPIRSGEHQLQKFAARKLPTVICLLDTTVSFHVEDFHVRAAMYGDETLYFAVSPSSGTGQFLGSGPGKNAMLRWDERTTVSAVAVLRQPSGSELVVDLYHNRYAIVPIEPSVTAPFVRRQIGIGIDAPERDAPTWFDLRDNPDYEDFWRDPESAMERVVREILEDKEGKY
jgi:hypothetical protein